MVSLAWRARRGLGGELIGRGIARRPRIFYYSY
jgi:hypothetical protein